MRSQLEFYGGNHMANGHGGARTGAGRPRKALSDALLDGTRPSRLKMAKMEGVELGDTSTPTAPECMQYLKDEQRMGELNAEKYFKATWDRLCKYKCENLFDVNYLQRFAMQQARYEQLEGLISRLSPLAKIANGDTRENPLEAMAMNRLKMINSMQINIDAVVRANCTEPFSGVLNIDPMEAILNG
jgi:hypothetical protein